MVCIPFNTGKELTEQLSLMHESGLRSDTEFQKKSSWGDFMISFFMVRIVELDGVL